VRTVGKIRRLADEFQWRLKVISLPLLSSLQDYIVLSRINLRAQFQT
jgi:hypothetical protein